jgi:dipeptidyl aminopeptidase/acylaminoacyl peptidase
MVGRSTRFRAAVTVYPVINRYSFTLTSDIGNMTSKYVPGPPRGTTSSTTRRGRSSRW